MKYFEHYQMVSVYFCLHYLVFVELEDCYISFQGDFYECESSLNMFARHHEMHVPNALILNA